jgi:hypothetical protein
MNGPNEHNDPLEPPFDRANIFLTPSVDLPSPNVLNHISGSNSQASAQLPHSNEDLTGMDDLFNAAREDRDIQSDRSREQDQMSISDSSEAETSSDSDSGKFCNH